MTTYLLDYERVHRVDQRHVTPPCGADSSAAARGSVILVSSIVASELWYGVVMSQRKESNARRLEAFFAGPLE